MYCKQEPDVTLIIIKSEWTRHLRDKILLKAERSVTVILVQNVNETYEKYLMFL